MKQPKITIGQDIVQLIAEIDEFKDRWQISMKLRPGRLQRLRDAAAVESIGASTRIAGATLTDAQVQALLSDVRVTAYRNRDEAEAAGYAETMELVIQAHQSLNLTEDLIHFLHRTLLRHIAKNEGTGNERAENESQQVKIESRELEDLVGWTSKALDGATMHPLLVIAIFKVTLLAIRPFQDGNGRLSRILTTLLLLRAGYDYVPYTSLEGVIEKDKIYYLKALVRTQSTLDDESPDWQPWFAFFLRCLKTQTSKLAPAVEYHEGTDSKELPPLSMEVLVLLSQHRNLTTTQIAEKTGANQNTLEPRLRELIDAGHIQGHGEAQEIWYSLPH